jgi:hypothetical protein
VQASEQLQRPVPVQPAAELRERDFGAFELCSDENYPTVWTQDAVSTASRPTPDGGLCHERLQHALFLVAVDGKHAEAISTAQPHHQSRHSASGEFSDVLHGNMQCAAIFTHRLDARAPVTPLSRHSRRGILLSTHGRHGHDLPTLPSSL